MDFDLAVVGAGPSGSTSARCASNYNDVVIFEEHSKQPVQCAGLVSKSGLERINANYRASVLNEITGARLYSPLKTVIEVDTKKTMAYVLDRAKFDEQLLNDAVGSGVTYINSTVTDIQDSNVITSDKKIKADKIILATGTKYELQRKLNLNTPKEFLIGAQYDMGVRCNPNLVELHFIVPEFFAWIIPVDNYARVGICTRKNPVPYLEDFIQRLRRDNRIKDDRVLNKIFGIIPIYNPKIKTEHGKISLLGDAAGQVKSTTGGGIVMGCTAAKFAYQENYEYLWRKEIGNELYLHLLAHRFIERLSPRNIDRLFSIVNDNRDSLIKHGDMDLASKTFIGLAKKPNFLMKLLINAPLFVFDML